MMRSIVPGALWVCSVPSTRWPVSAAVSAVADRLEVAHLADEDHVGVLAQGARSASPKLGRVGADLALVDDAALVAVHELDRVLDREDVVGAVAVDLVDHRGERRRLARAGRARDEHEAARRVGQLGEARGGRPSSSSVFSSSGIEPEGGAERLALEVDVHAEAREAGDRVREVELPLDLELLLLLGREDPVEQLTRVLGRRAPGTPRAARSAAHADRGRRAHAQMQIRRAPRHHLLQELSIECRAEGAEGVMPVTKWAIGTRPG